MQGAFMNQKDMMIWN